MTGVIGVDLSLTGSGISDGHTTWIVRSKGTRADTLPTRGSRLRTIADTVLTRIVTTAGEHGPDLLVLEAPAFASSSGHAHDRSGLWWLVVDRVLTVGWPLLDVPPATLKKYATGKGNAGKHEVIGATVRRFPQVDTGDDDNRCDALWLAALGHDLLGQPLTTMPATHRTALAALTLPAAA